MIAITTCNKEGWKLYGHEMARSFIDRWPDKVSLILWTEGFTPDFKSDRLIVRDLFDDTDLDEFKDSFSILSQEASKRGWHYNYRFDAVRFAHKVFALTNPETLRLADEHDLVFWVDADTLTTLPPSSPHLKALCPDEFLLSYLGRKKWNHSECGFVAYNLRRGGVEFLEEFRRSYVSGEILGMLEWHDSYVFDVLRKRFESLGHKALNLSPECPGLDAYEHSPLKDFMVHYKGNRKFKKGNGDAL